MPFCIFHEKYINIYVQTEKNVYARPFQQPLLPRNLDSAYRSTTYNPLSFIKRTGSLAKVPHPHFKRAFSSIILRPAALLYLPLGGRQRIVCDATILTN